jgi:hypothetical protein
MKKIYSKLIAVLALVATTGVFSSCNVANQDNASIINDVIISGPGVVNHEAVLEMESTLQLSCTSKFNGRSEVVWKSSDETVATVDPKTGLVTPVSPGTVMITAYTKTDPVSQGDYVIVTVVGKNFGIVDDALDQSEAE